MKEQKTDGWANMGKGEGSQVGKRGQRCRVGGGEAEQPGKSQEGLCRLGAQSRRGREDGKREETSRA